MTDAQSPPEWDDGYRVHAVDDGSGPPPYHVRDQERLHAARAPCELPPAARAALTPVRLTPYPATVWLPAPKTIEPEEVPDADWQGWHWPSGGHISLMVYRTPELPGLNALEGPGAGACRAIVGGRPMLVARRDPDDTGRTFRAWVDGFLSDTTRLWACAGAESAAERDALLAALLTFTPDEGHPSARPA